MRLVARILRNLIIMGLTSKKIISKNFFDFLARVLVSSIFISAIPSKIFQFSEIQEYIASKGIPQSIAGILLVGAIICLGLGSGFFIFSKEKNLGAIFLLLFLIPTTLIFHFSPFQQRALLINSGLAGALVLSITRK